MKIVATISTHEPTTEAEVHICRARIARYRRRLHGEYLKLLAEYYNTAPEPRNQSGVHTPPRSPHHLDDKSSGRSTVAGVPSGGSR